MNWRKRIGYYSQISSQRFLSFAEREVAIQAGYEAMKALLPTLKSELADGN